MSNMGFSDQAGSRNRLSDGTGVSTASPIARRVVVDHSSI